MKVFLVLCLFLVSCTSYVASDVSFVSLDSGNISVSFCPDCEDVLVRVLSFANSSINCAFYRFSSEPVTNAILEKSLQVPVRLVFDKGEKNSFSFSRVARSKGLMHNKFCIVDKKTVVMGSYNPSKQGYLNDNNVVVVNSERIAFNYLQEFEELWANSSNVPTPQSSVVLSDVLVENYFCPDDGCTSKVVDVLRKANKSISFLAFSFTSDRIANTLLLKHQAGLVVRGVVDAAQASGKYSKFDVLSYHFPVFRDNNKFAMHHKFFIVDNQTVITGSFNPTESANTRNDENILIIHSQEVAVKFLQEFDRVFSLSQG